jgi:hypothetical protein
MTGRQGVSRRALAGVVISRNPLQLPRNNEHEADGHRLPLLPLGTDIIQVSHEMTLVAPARKENPSVAYHVWRSGITAPSILNLGTRRTLSDQVHTCRESL